MTSVVPTSLELYFVRHAVAAERGTAYPDDGRRPLTPEGAQRWKTAVVGLRAFGVQVDVVLTSPLMRAEETAAILAAGLKPAPRVITVDALAPGARLADVSAAITAYAGVRKASRLALVGHEPDLGELAAKLLGARGAIEFKKGAVCRIDVARAMPGGPGVLRWFVPPRVLRGLAP